ncbi:hypothetical protein E4649_21065 [Escherichia coli]|uniref:W0003 n=1 Tax=Escherichia coli TaxID=562 RepID=A0A377HEG6_ECOLX|nr:w0003-like protein [Escherichia coli 53638]EEW2891132.1 hypothetical protein [Escherichia coli]EFX5204114.1 hypothetical protein [Shigella flexneri]EFZ60923.1 yihA [Escherichia coli LT-68]EEY4960683.1 hypothetical protein [Escherichia coli]
MKLIIFILIVLIIAALLIRIILRSVNQHSPLLMQLHAAGIRTGDAERILSSGECWQRQKTLLTEREVSFMKGLFRIVDMKRDQREHLNRNLRFHYLWSMKTVIS